MKLSRKFIALAAGPLALLATYAFGADSPYESNTVEITIESAFVLETIEEGNFAATLSNGLHKLTIKADGTPLEKDVTCIIIKDSDGRVGSFNDGFGYGYLGLSCDFD